MFGEDGEGGPSSFFEQGQQTGEAERGDTDCEEYDRFLASKRHVALLESGNVKGKGLKNERTHDRIVPLI